MTSVNASFAKLLEYEQRATGAEAASESSDAKGDWAALAFRLGEERLVCSVERIVESLPLPPVTRVPGTKPFILGLANVRGVFIGRHRCRPRAAGPFILSLGTISK